MRTLWHEARVALRMLLRAPFVTVPALVVLTLGIGMAAALYAVVYATWLAPLPYQAPGRLVSVLTRYPSYKLDALASSDFGEWQGTRSLGALAAYNVGKTVWIGSDETLEIGQARISGNLLDVMGVHAALGRGIEVRDDDPGAARVVMLCDGLWRERFGGDRGVLGVSMNLEGERYTVVGVLPAGFRMPEQNRVDVLTPLALDKANLHHGSGGAKLLRGLARLQPDATVATAGAELATRLAASRAEEPSLYGDDVSVRVVPVAEYAGGDVRLAALVLVGAVAAILLIACANVASLLMARAVGRDREMAVRIALGASPWRIARLLLLEGLALAAGGIGAGILVAAALIRMVESLRPAELFQAFPARLSSHVLAVVIPALLACSLAFSLAPALPLPRLRLRRALVVVELALSLVLLVGAALLLQSLARLSAVSPGFQTEGLVAASVSAPGNAAELRLELRQRLERVPGVLAVSFAGPLPPTGFNRISAFSRADRPVPDPSWQRETVVVRLVDEQYFRVMGIPLLQGRLLTAADLAGDVPVAVVNRTFANRYFAGDSALGKQVDGAQWKTVIGVVADTRNDGLRNAVRPEIDLPFTPAFQAEGGGVTNRSGLQVLIRSSGDPAAIAHELLRSLHQIDARLVANTHVMEEQWQGPRAAMKFEASVLTAFAVLALVMASVGIHGVLSHVVVLRYREMGVRLALGARPGNIQALVVREALLLAGGGIVIGLAGSLAVSRLLGSMLYEIRPQDPVTLAMTSALLLLIAVCASAAPARRASRQNPAEVLRAQ